MNSAASTPGPMGRSRKGIAGKGLQVYQDLRRIVKEYGIG